MTTKKEQKSISSQIDSIMDTAFDQFRYLITRDLEDDAISLGDEFLDWMKDIETSNILFYNEHELKQTYDLLVQERKNKRK